MMLSIKAIFLESVSTLGFKNRCSTVLSIDDLFKMTYLLFIYLDNSPLISEVVVAEEVGTHLTIETHSPRGMVLEKRTNTGILKRMMDPPKMNGQIKFKSWEMMDNYRHLRLPKLLRVIEHPTGFSRPCYMLYSAYQL